jgi:hypothetical protein
VWKRAAVLLGPPLLAAAVYVGSAYHPFVYDDVRLVVQNPSLRDLSNFRFVLLYQPFRPVVNVSYALDYWFWQLEPVGYHLTNVSLHSLNTLLLFLLCARLPGAGRTAAPADGSRAVAALAATLFAVHPLASKAVGYVSARILAFHLPLFAVVGAGRVATLPLPRDRTRAESPRCRQPARHLPRPDRRARRGAAGLRRSARTRPKLCASAQQPAHARRARSWEPTMRHPG